MPKMRKPTIDPSRPLMTDVHPANSPYNMTDAEGLKQWLKAWHENNSTKSVFVAKDEKELTNRTPSILIVNLSTEDKIINAIKTEVDEILAELAEQGGSHPGFKSQPINWDELRLNQVRIVVDPQHRKYYEVLVSGASPICTPLIEHIKDNMTFGDVVIKANW